jgi:hypothetical protein
MYVSGRPDWKVPQIALAARLLTEEEGVSSSKCFDLLFIMDEPPHDKGEPPHDFPAVNFG